MRCNRGIYLPRSPPKIKSVRIIENPFDDIVPRITAEEKRVQQRARQVAIREREEAARRKGAKKCVFFYPTDTRSTVAEGTSETQSY